MDTTATLLHAAIAAVCPIEGVCVLDPRDKAGWRIAFAAQASEAQREAAARALAEFKIEHGGEAP